MDHKKSKDSRKSTKSDHSQSSVKTASSGLSQLSTLAKTISQDLKLATEVLETLVNNWDIDYQNLQSFIPDYKPAKWTKEMRARHKKYHDYDNQRKSRMKKFNDHFKTNCQGVDPTAEDLEKLRVLAIEWADDAVTVAEARLQFLIENQNAYKDHNAVKGHLSQIKDMINSANKALTRQRGIRDDIKAKTAKK